MGYTLLQHCTVVKKHKLTLLGPSLTTLGAMGVAVLLFVLGLYLKGQGSSTLVLIILATICLTIVFIAFIRLFVIYTCYVTDQVVIDPLHLTLVSAKLFIQDNTEIFDLDEVVKMTIQKQGLISNIFNMGSIYVESKNDDIKLLKHIPNPHRFVKIFEKNKNRDIKHETGIFSA